MTLFGVDVGAALLNVRCRLEAYVDLVPGAWTKIKIEVRGEYARLYVHDNEQPTLIVPGLKSGAEGHGGIALWLEPGTVAHFRNLVVERSARHGGAYWTPTNWYSIDTLNGHPLNCLCDCVGVQVPGCHLSPPVDELCSYALP